MVPQNVGGMLTDVGTNFECLGILRIIGWESRVEVG